MTLPNAGTLVFTKLTHLSLHHIEKDRCPQWRLQLIEVSEWDKSSPTLIPVFQAGMVSMLFCFLAFYQKMPCLHDSLLLPYPMCNCPDRRRFLISLLGVFLACHRQKSSKLYWAHWGTVCAFGVVSSLRVSSTELASQRGYGGIWCINEGAQNSSLVNWVKQGLQWRVRVKCPMALFICYIYICFPVNLGLCFPFSWAPFCLPQYLSSILHWD